MKVEILNQYRAIVDLGEYGKTEEVYRTKSSLEDFVKYLLESETSDTIIAEDEDTEWKDDGQVTCAFGFCQNADGNIKKVQTFYKNAKKSKYKQWYTLEELLEHDLIYVQGYGIVEDREQFEKDFRSAAQKK